MVARSTANTAPYICHHSDGVTSTMYCCCFIKENVILLKNNASITRPQPGRAPLTPIPKNARDFRPVLCSYFCYWLAATRHPGFQPLSPPSNLHPPPVQLVPRRTCYEVVQQVVVWFDCFYSDTQGCCGSLYTVYIQKLSVLWRSPLLLQIN